MLMYEPKVVDTYLNTRESKRMHEEQQSTAPIRDSNFFCTDRCRDKFEVFNFISSIY